MEPVGNQVEIPTEKISEAFERAAVPGFTGSVTAHIRVLPTAGHEVRFRFETNTVHKLDKDQDPEMPLVTNARVARVRRAFAENAEKFVLGTQLSRVVGKFEDGELVDFVVGREFETGAIA